jgi:superfamily II DNA/RNA helicase
MSLHNETLSSETGKITPGFQAFDLPESILQALNTLSFHQPTPIQTQTIPIALGGRDILGSAETGSGKTIAYGIPLLTALLKNPEQTALVLAPTRELATQILKSLVQLLDRHSQIRGVLLIGGDPIYSQLKVLKNKPRLLVGTPGRINDHLQRGTLKLDSTSFLVLDETDRMLDMGFGVQLERIAEYLPQKRQTLMFSATLPQYIIQLSKTYLTHPERIAIGSTTQAAPKIKQLLLKTTEAEKYDLLTNQLNEYPGSFIIFVKTKFGTERLAKRLQTDGFSADAIHGDLRQRNRDRVLNGFRKGQHRILVATDVAARGLDVPNIECVVNYDLPQCPEDYIHRIGRTGRAGMEGNAINLLTPQDQPKWRDIDRLLNPQPGRAPRSEQSGSPSHHRHNQRRADWPPARGTQNERFKFKTKTEHGQRPYRSENKDRSGFQAQGFSNRFSKDRDFGSPEAPSNARSVNGNTRNAQRAYPKQDGFQPRHPAQRAYPKQDGFQPRHNAQRAYPKQDGFQPRGSEQHTERKSRFPSRDGFQPQARFEKRDRFQERAPANPEGRSRSHTAPHREGYRDRGQEWSTEQRAPRSTKSFTFTHTQRKPDEARPTLRLKEKSKRKDFAEQDKNPDRLP